MKQILILCFFFLLSQNSSFAQNVVFSAQASATTIGIEDRVQVDFTLENIEGIQGIQNPNFPGFKVLGGPYESRSSNLYLNGNQPVRSTSLTLSYVLQATQIGDITIPPLSAKDGNGKVYQSNALKIKVVKGSLAQQRRQQQQSADPFAGFDPFDDPFFGGNGGGGDPFAAMRQQMQQLQQQMQQQMQQSMGPAQNLPQVTEKELGKNVFIKVSVDKTKVHIGEQITATYKMYARVNMQAQLSKLPSLNGFWTQDFELPKDQKPQYETLDGVQYQSFTLKKSALFPQQTGTLILDAAEANGVAQIADRSNPYGKNVQFKLKSAPVNITVTPLPIKDQPTDFSGAVGSNFMVKTKIDKTSLSTDDAATLTIDISGVGNIKLIGAPKLNLPNGLDAFDPVITDTITGRSTTISGHKIFSFAISPSIAGDYEIPAIPFSYYDPAKGSYTTLYTTALKLHVTQGTKVKKEIAGNKLLSDLNNIDTKPLLLQPSNGTLLYSKAYWSIYALTFIALLLFAWRKKQKESEANNQGLFKNKYANKIALKRLKTAKTFLDKKETIPFYEEISKAIWLYLSDKLNIPLSQLSKETALESLRSKQITEAQLSKMYLIIEDCAMALYAPSGAAQQMNSTYNDTVQLIGELEENLKK